MVPPAATRPPRATVDGVARRARVAVAVLFVGNGLTVANVVPWLPEIKAELALTNTAFGLGWAAFPAGGLVLGMAAAPLSARIGSGPTATRCALVGALALPAVAVAPVWAAFAAALFVVGAADGITDAAMNAHGLRVQRRYGRSIINGFHALWSLGAVIGGLVGAAAVGLGVPRLLHLSAVAASLTVALLSTARWLLPGRDGAEEHEEGTGPTHDRVAGERSVGAGTGDGREAAGFQASDGQPAAPGARRGVAQALRTAPLLLLGFAALPAMSGAIEDTAASWSAIHLRETLGAAPFAAGLGFVAAQAMMVVGRLAGDRVVDRFSPARVARTGSVLAAAGMLAVAAAPGPSAAIAGFALAGIGAATLFPLGMAAAGEIPGVASADGVAIVSWVARLSFLAVPPLVGVVADAAGLRWGMALIVGCALVAAALSGLLDRVGRAGTG